MDKRAEITFSTIITAFYRFVILFLVAITMVFFVLHFMKMTLNVFDIESQIFAQGLLNSPHGISYRVDNRVYAGIIDYSSFKDKTLMKVLDDGFYAGDKKTIAAKIELLSGTTAYRSLQAIYYNEDRFNAWYALGKTGFPGPGGAQVLEKLYPVLVKDGASYEQATLKITVAMPRT